MNFSTFHHPIQIIIHNQLVTVINSMTVAHKEDNKTPFYREDREDVGVEIAEHISLAFRKQAEQKMGQDVKL